MNQQSNGSRNECKVHRDLCYYWEAMHWHWHLLLPVLYGIDSFRINIQNIGLVLFYSNWPMLKRDSVLDSFHSASQCKLSISVSFTNLEEKHLSAREGISHLGPFQAVTVCHFCGITLTFHICYIGCVVRVQFILSLATNNHLWDLFGLQYWNDFA